MRSRRNAHVLEEHLAELGVARHLPAAGRTLMPGVFMSTSRRLMPLCFGASDLGAAEQEAPVGDVGVAGPHLLAVRRRSRRRDARPGCGAPPRSEPAPGSEKPWHHRVVAGHQAGAGSAALRLGAVAAGSRGRSCRRRLRRAGEARRRGRGLCIEEPALDHGRAAAAVLARPRDGGPPAVEEPLLPLARDLAIQSGSSARVQQWSRRQSSGRLRSSQARASSAKARSADENEKSMRRET